MTKCSLGLTLVVVSRTAVELKNDAKAHVLNHANVVTFYAMVFEPGHYGIVLEFVPRGSLDELVYKCKVLFADHMSQNRSCFFS